MNDRGEMVATLREALGLTPENVVLRRQLASMLMQADELEQAEQLLREGLERVTPGSESLQLVLAECFERQGKVDEALVVAEELTSRSDGPAAARLILARLRLRTGDVAGGAEAYRRAVAADASLANDDLAEALGVEDDASAEDEDEFGHDAAHWAPAGASLPPVELERPETRFEDVGGLEAVKEQIRLKIIAPIQHADLYRAYGKAVGGGILMYGPPGCGKTHLARATAGEVEAAFLCVGIHDVLDMFIGNSEKQLHALFEHARRNAPCVLFFDEVDALGARRNDASGAVRSMINQFLAEMDGLGGSNDGVLVLGATNAPWHLDTAFRRPGRFDQVIFVPPPDEPGRAAVLSAQLRDKPADDIDHAAVAKRTRGFSGADLKAVVDTAVEAKLVEAMKTGVPTPLRSKDLLRAAKAVKPTTKEWFATARNYALYSNEGGQYDDVLDYLNLR